MTIFGCALLIALIGTLINFASKSESGRSMTWMRLRSLSSSERTVVGFFLATLFLALLDQAYWLYYWQTPNYLVVLPGLGAFAGIVYLTSLESPEAGVYGLSSAKMFERWSMFAVFSVFLAFYAVTGVTSPSPYNAHVLQAIAFLHGHTNIPQSPSIEQVTFGGRYFQLHPPLPAFLLMPFAAIWGTDTNQTVFSLVSGAIDAALAWWMLGRLRLSVSVRVWLTLFFAAGTVIWFDTLNGGSWDVSQIVAVGFTLAALGEVFGAARPGVVGLLSGLSALARNDLALDFPIFIGLCYVRRRNLWELLWMAPGFALAGVIYVGLNEARFNSVFDLGQFLYTPGTPTFAMVYFPQNFYTLIFLAPRLDTRFPFIHPIASGQALTFTSPAFVLALRASLADIDSVLLFLGALLAMMPSLFFNNNGGAQFGTRHYIHSFPFLLVLMAKGLPGYVDQITRILVVVSIVLIAIGVIQTRFWGFAP